MEVGLAQLRLGDEVVFVVTLVRELSKKSAQ